LSRFHKSDYEKRRGRRDKYFERGKTLYIFLEEFMKLIKRGRGK